MAVQMLGQIDAPRASRGLAMLTVFSDSTEVRRTATETLRGRDTRDFLGPVIALLRNRVKYEVRPVGGPGSPGALFVEGQRFNVQRLYSPPPMPEIPLFAGEPVTYDEYGLPVISRFLGTTDDIKTEFRQERWDTGPRDPAQMRAARTLGFNPLGVVPPTAWTATTTTTTTPIERSIRIPIGQLMLQYQTAARVAQQQQSDDVRAVEEHNAVVGRLNDRVTQVLRGATGEDFGEDPQAWSAWWVDQLGYAYKAPKPRPVPTYVENVPLNYLPTGVATPGSTLARASTIATEISNGSSPGGVATYSCFEAGTPVHTLAGPRPIESIRVGDRALTQDGRTVALSYQPVLAVFHNRPAATLRIDLGGETIVATPIHRFWKAGRGWVMARDLKPGDPLRTLDGPARVRSVEPDRVQPVFNLQVAQGSSFFVGSAGTLAHDNSLLEPVTTPFDAPPKLATVAAAEE